MRREQIESNHRKLKQLEDYENLREILIEGKNMWWAITTPKHPKEYGTMIAEQASRDRFMSWLENEITILKIVLELEDEDE